MRVVDDATRAHVAFVNYVCHYTLAAGYQQMMMNIICYDHHSKEDSWQPYSVDNEQNPSKSAKIAPVYVKLLERSF